MNSFSFTLSGKHFICPSILNDSFAGQSNLGCRSLTFMTSNTSFQPLLACRVSLEKSGDNLMGTALQVTVSFSLAGFKILFVFNLWHFNYVSQCHPLCLRHSVLPGLVCLFSLPNYGSFFMLFFQVSFQFLALPLLLLAPLTEMLVCLEMSQRLVILPSCFFLLLWLNAYFLLCSKSPI